MKNLKEEWIKVCSKYSRDMPFIYHTSSAIFTKYEESHRHYHNTQHILNFYTECQKIKTNINDYDSFFFAIIFHDVIYSTSNKDNEQKSAEYARKILTPLGFPTINNVENLIIRTENHTQIEANEKYDTQAFLDLDLCILGSSPEQYKEYSDSIRKEWKHVPSFLYKPGRKKILQQFLQEKSIYRLPEFKNKYEQQARQNIQQELLSL